jgi:uncharacterized repeat protein (TIGR03803 family)
MNRDRSLGILGAAQFAGLVVLMLLVAGAQAQSNYKTLHRFGGEADGAAPYAGLVFDKNGNLYGTTSSGGSHGQGAIFKLTPEPDGSWAETVLYNFCSTTACGDGSHPQAGLIFDALGNLYGTASMGGNLECDCGVAFELTMNKHGTWMESVLHTFHGSPDGGTPLGALIFDAAGNLYGTAYSGGDPNCEFGNCGVVFKLARNADGHWTETVLHKFEQDGGVNPYDTLVFDAGGSLYGTTAWGGDLKGCNGGGCGVVFELTPNANGNWGQRVLYRFTGADDGGSPWTGVVFDQSGNLYGTTRLGGFNCPAGSSCGVVFQLTPNSDGSWTESTLRRFGGLKDGWAPVASLVLDQSGNLYGTTSLGGAPACYYDGWGCGLVFRLTPTADRGWKKHVLHAFWDHPGTNPNASLIFDGAGNLYGTTLGDGTTTFGSVFEITP